MEILLLSLEFFTPKWMYVKIEKIMSFKTKFMVYFFAIRHKNNFQIFLISTVNCDSKS